MTPLRFAVALGFLAAASLTAAQPNAIPDWENSVQFELVASQQPLRPGDQFEVALVVEIEEGYHLYGPEEQEPSRTEVAVAGDHVEPGTASFPPVETRELAGLGTYDLYEGTIAIKVPVTLSKSTKASEHTLVATVNYQVCTDFACSAPTSDELSLTVRGDTAGATIEQQHPEIFERK